MFGLPVPPLFSPPVLAELQQADVITSEECKWLYDMCDVVRFQKDKSPEVMFKTAKVLRRHGLEKESNFFIGRQSRPTSICLCVHVCACLW